MANLCIQSGLRVSFMPLIIPTHATIPSNSQPVVDRFLPSSEPIYLNLQKWSRGHYGRGDTGGEYLTFWYVGQIPEDAVRLLAQFHIPKLCH